MQRKATDAASILRLILKRHPQATLWAKVVSDIVDGMMERTYESGRVALPADAHPEIVFEMAKLVMFASERVLDDRLKGGGPGDIDVRMEAEYLTSPYGRERVRNTSIMFADRIWNRMYDEYVVKYPLLASSAAASERPYGFRKRRRGAAPAVKRNHYIPAFADRPWSADTGLVLVARHTVSGEVDFVPRAPLVWGYEEFLYPPWLESYFHAAESDAAPQYKRILETTPLSIAERRTFSSLLVLQMVRTPAFMSALAVGLRRASRENGWTFATNPGSLRNAFEGIFREDSIRATMHERLSSRRWSLLAAAPPWGFPRVDAGVVRAVLRGRKRASWLFPLTPTTCLCIGPDRAAPTDPPVPLTRSLEVRDTRGVIARLAEHTVGSLLVPKIGDTEQWRQLLMEHMGTRVSEAVRRYRTWGALARGV